MKAILRQVRISPKKANLIASLIRNKKAVEAIDVLKFTPKKAAAILKKLLESAIANAENNFKQNKDNLNIKEIIVTKGATYKRSVPISRGRSHPILKRTSHITIQLEAKKEEQAKTKPVEAKKEVKETKKKDEKPSKPTKKSEPKKKDNS